MNDKGEKRDQELAYRRYVLGHLRMARKRAQMLIVEIDSIGKALKADWITPDQALGWLRDDALTMVQSEPFETVRYEAETARVNGGGNRAAMPGEGIGDDGTAGAAAR